MRAAENILNNDWFKPLIFKIFIAGILWFGFMYLAFMGQMINNIVQSEGMEKELIKVSQDYQNMEGKYLGLIKELDLGQILELGLIEQQENIKYASKQKGFAKAEGGYGVAVRD